MSKTLAQILEIVDIDLIAFREALAARRTALKRRDGRASHKLEEALCRELLDRFRIGDLSWACVTTLLHETIEFGVKPQLLWDLIPKVFDSSKLQLDSKYTDRDLIQLIVFLEQFGPTESESIAIWSGQILAEHLRTCLFSKLLAEAPAKYIAHLEERDVVDDSKIRAPAMQPNYTLVETLLRCGAAVRERPALGRSRSCAEEYIRQIEDDYLNEVIGKST